METATQEAQGRVRGLADPFLSLSSSTEEDGGAGGYGRRDGGLEAWSLLNFFFGLDEEEEEEEKEEEDVDELVSWDDVVVSGCGLGGGGLGISPPHVGCHSWFLGSGFCRAGLLVAPRAVFFPVVVYRPRCSACWSVWTRRTVMQWPVRRADFPVVVQRPIPMVLLLRRPQKIPLLLLNTVIDGPVVRVLQFRTSSKALCIWQSVKWWPCSLLTTEVAYFYWFCWWMQFALCSLRCRQARSQVVTWYGWFGWCRRTLRYVPFFCSQAQMLASWPVLNRRTVARCIPVTVYWCVDFPCRGAEVYSHGLLFRRPLRFSCCSSTRCSMSLLHRSCSLLVVVLACRQLWLPQLQFLSRR